MEITKALEALQPLYGRDNIEIVTLDGTRIRGLVHSLKTTQSLTTPSVKIKRADGQVIKIPLTTIAVVRDLDPTRDNE